MYLLPCHCGEKIEVDRSQAGLPVRCRCGAELTVPTLRGLAQLEQITPRSQSKQATWGMRQGMMFLGAVLSVGAAVAVAALLVTAPKYPQAVFDQIVAGSSSTADIEGASPVQLLDAWKRLRDDPEFTASHQFEELNYGVQKFYEPALAANRKRLKLAIAVGVIGLVTLGVSLFMPRQRPHGG